jgi:hypothetical protein
MAEESGNAPKPLALEHALPTPTGEFRIGGILRRSRSIYFRHFPTFLALGIVPALASLAPNQGAIHHIADFVLIPIGQAMVLYGAFQAMRGRPVRLGESIAKGMARFLPVIGVSLLAGLVIVVASILLLVPGLIMATKLYVVMPACIVERLGVFASLERSGELTMGHRWPIFALLLLSLLLAIAFNLVPAALARVGGATVPQIGDFIGAALDSAFQSIVVVVAYHDLRVAKDGVDIDRIAAVFD